MAYNEFAYFYDEFNGEADYDALYAHIRAELQAHGIQDGILADLGCGTGELTLMLTQAGYDMIGIDQSEEMLCVVRDKAEQLGLSGRLLLLRQDLLKLDLYGTVDAAICCLDSLNYLTSPADVQRTFQRLHLFIAPGGELVFDVNTLDKFQSLDGQVFLDETEESYCVWRTEFRRNICSYWVDLFRKGTDGRYRRDTELHRQRYYAPEELAGWLREAGFGNIRVYGDCRLRRPKDGEQRIYFCCTRE